MERVCKDQESVQRTWEDKIQRDGVQEDRKINRSRTYNWVWFTDRYDRISILLYRVIMTGRDKIQDTIYWWTKARKHVIFIFLEDTNWSKWSDRNIISEIPEINEKCWKRGFLEYLESRFVSKNIENRRL